MALLLESFSRRGLVFGLAAAFASLLRAAEPKVVVPPYNTVSDKEEILLGDTFADKLAEDLHLLEDQTVSRYADRIVQRLAETCRRKGIPYRIQVVDTAEVNAFALPGGRLFLNRGLIQWARNEGELAAVLAHEVGHVVGRHGMNQVMRFAMAKNLFEELKTAVGLNQTALSQVIDMLGGPAVLLAQLHYSREAESEADLLGAYNMQRAGWAPRHAVTMLQRLGGGGASGASPAGLLEEVFSVLSDHPTSSSRAAAAPPAGGSARGSKPHWRATRGLMRILRWKISPAGSPCSFLCRLIRSRLGERRVVRTVPQRCRPRIG